MYYNIENYNMDMERLFSDYTGYKLGQGWPAYKNMSVEQMAEIMDDNSLVPRYDSRSGSSAVVIPSTKTDMPKRDIDLMKALYSSLNKLINKYVEKIVDEYEYIDSPIYAEDGIDRETLAQIVDRVIRLAEEELDDAQEISLETQQAGLWNRRNLFKNAIEAIVLSEIFAVRRPNYRRIRANYVYNNGRYDGVRER
ncbi:MAG: hypothetical protein Q4D26_01570 [Clostridia bacterium]|nr:hypothetical protein [Clostridia bacterium]